MAADIYKFLVVIAGLTILFNLAGLPTSGYLIERAIGGSIGDASIENFSLNPLLITLMAIVASAGLVGLSVGFLTKSSPELFLLAAYASALLFFIVDMISIAFFSENTWTWWVSILLILPISIGYAHSVIAWWTQRS
jgi:amino acid permease|tara:strand:+ start:141 stop:551 length:411 start_codon:yes stop_codon:yes gene_type:complete